MDWPYVQQETHQEKRIDDKRHIPKFLKRKVIQVTVQILIG